MNNPRTHQIRAWFDGACEPKNPGGHAAWGTVVEVDGAVVLEKLGYVGYGPGMTSNVAEYCGCIAVLEQIAEHKGDAIVFSDSQMVINQMRGDWKVKKGAYVPYFKQAKTLLETVGADRVELQWIPRDQNRRADTLSRKALTEIELAPCRKLQERDESAEIVNADSEGIAQLGAEVGL